MYETKISNRKWIIYDILGNIEWIAFSAGAALIMVSGCYIVRSGKHLLMPSFMIPVSCCNLSISDKSYARMKEIEKRDIMMFA